MRAAGVEPNSYVYVALINACERSSDWRRALKVFDTMKVRPCITLHLWHITNLYVAANVAAILDIQPACMPNFVILCEEIHALHLPELSYGHINQRCQYYFRV